MMKATFSSNLCKILFKKLKENFFINRPDTEAYIFVPNRFVKQWLMKEVCDDSSIKVAFNINFISIKNFLNFFENLLEIPHGKRFLSYLKLHFLLRQKITNHILDTNLKYLDLSKYLIKDGKILQKRLNSLTDELCNDFLRYSIFGNFSDLQKKMKDHWQANLFYDIFYIDENPLCFRDLKHIEQTFEDCSFHFFAIDYIPPLYFDFINRLSNVYHYFISPCKLFWEDVVSDFERQKIQKYWKRQNVSEHKIEELSFYLKDRNSFLANMEKLKKDYLKTMNNYDNFEMFESYSNVLDDNQALTLLKQFQKDILNLENRENDFVNIEKEDFSIQVHIATSKFREIQILHSNILKLLSTNDDITLKDITIIAPNIDEYLPFIHMIFSNREETINYKISNISLTDESYLLAGLKKIFSIAHCNWEKIDVLALFENPLFQKKHKLSKEDVSILFELLEKANISWGFDEDHVKTVMKDKNLSSDSLYEKTFEAGFSRILFGLVFIFNSKYVDSSFTFDFWPDGLDISKSNILDKVLKIFVSLKNDLKAIHENKKLTLSEWTAFFMEIMSDHFSLNFQKDDFEINNHFIEKSAYDACLEFFDNLKEIAKKFNKDKFLFEVIAFHFEKHLKRCKTHFNPNDQMAIHFTSFDASYLPSKAVFIIGLDEKALEFKTQNSLSLTSNLSVPLENDHIRSRFLQSLLSAEKYLILSYTAKEGQLIDSSILLQELFTYLDDSYRILKQRPSAHIIKKHPSFSFHKSYLAKKGISLSDKEYLAAKVYYGKNNKSEAKFKDDFKSDIIINDDIPEIIDLKSLRNLSKNPIKFYLNEGLDIYLEAKKDISDFNVSFLDKYLMKKDSLNTKIEDILFSYEKIAKMPLGFFGEIEKRDIIRSYTEFHENLKNLGVDKDKIISIDLNPFCENFEKLDENNLKMPAIEVSIRGKKVKIIGILGNISNNGLLVYSDDKISSLVQIWAEILVFYKLKLNLKIPKQILFIKNNKVKDFKIEDLDQNLSNYIEYYLRCKKRISYMIAPFSEHILNKDEKSFRKAINNINKNRIIDVYFTWLSQNNETLDVKKIIETQADYMQSIFRAIREESSESF